VWDLIFDIDLSCVTQYKERCPWVNMRILIVKISGLNENMNRGYLWFNHKKYINMP
jgi:hypothetical protein